MAQFNSHLYASPYQLQGEKGRGLIVVLQSIEAIHMGERICESLDVVIDAWFRRITGRDDPMCWHLPWLQLRGVSVYMVSQCSKPPLT